MSLFLLHPAALWTAAGLAAVVLLHLLQQRWKRRLVPSLVLWRRVLARGIELRARRPSLDVALILGAAAAACLVAASTGPRLLTTLRGRRGIAVVIDNGTASLTESFTETGRAATRLAEAKLLAREVLAELDPGTQATLVATSDTAHVVARAGPTEAAVRALERIVPVQVTGSLAEAVSLALADSPGEVVVVTHRALPPAPAHVRRVPVGRASRNLAITCADFSRTEAFVAVRNFSPRDAEASLVLRALAPERKRLASLGVRVPAGGRTTAVLVPSAETAAALADATAVEVELAHLNDDLDADNVVYASRVRAGARRIGVVGQPGEGLSRALWAAGAETVALSSAGASSPEGIGDLDALLFAGELPASWPPPAGAMLIAPGRSAGPVELAGDELRNVRAMFAGVERDDAVTRGFPPVELGVSSVARARIFTAHVPLVVSSGGAETLAAQFRDGGRPFVWLGFTPEDAGWNRRASFPVFVARALDFLGGRDGGRGAGGERSAGRLGFARVGESPRQYMPPETATARLPGGREVTREGRLMEAGLYRAGETPLAVNLVSERESDNRIAQVRTAGERASADAKTAAAARVRALDLAGALAALACMLLAAEWIVSARRA